MPPESRVYVAEDSESFRRIYPRVLSRGGHTVVASSATFQEAIDFIQNPDSPAFDVAIVDGNLSEGRHDGVEGNEIIARIREMFPDRKILGVSAEPANFRGTDASMEKDDVVRDFDLLVKTVTEL